MAARLADGRSVLDVQRLAVSLLGEALERRGDAFSLCAFASNGREDVRMTDIKTFGERFDEAAMSSLAGLRPGRERDDETILFWHRGLSLSDIALGYAMLQKGERLGIGQRLRFA